ncbi:MAG: DNA polymerase III subunit beta [Flavobacteriales bacterium]|jgi:DNA polymerase-3 subunit beta
MKFIVTSTALLKQLQQLSGVLNSSNTLPILDNFLFEIKNKALTISASDLETAMSTQMAIEAKEEGVIAIPAKILLEILKSLPEQPLTFTIDKKTLGVEISSDYGKYKLTGANGDDFPKTPALSGAKSLSITGEALSRAINKTLFAAGNDDMRPIMSGVFFEIHENEVRFVATDAHKLVRYTRTDVGGGGAASFVVPRKPLNLLKGALSTHKSEVKIEYTENNALFTLDNVVLMCRLIEGKFPNYEAVIPKENPFKLTIDRLDLQSSIKRVSIFANKTTHQVRLKVGGSELNISAEDLDFANEAQERLTCSYAGDDMEIGFNSRFLNEMLTNLDSENVNIEMSAPNRAGIITQVESDNAGEDILMLVMPVMLNG